MNDLYDFTAVAKFIQQAAAQSAPGTGRTKLYFKTDGKLYYISAGGTETLVPTNVADLGIPDPLIYKGVIDCAASPNYPAADAGHLYIVSAAGKIGGASGIVVAVGDTLICKTDSSAAGTQAAVGANWNVLEKNQDFSNITITGGTIDGTTIGSTTPAAGTFTTIKTMDNIADTTLSGTPKVFVIYDSTGTPYYFKAYPVKQ